MNFTEYLINEFDMTSGMAKTRQAIGAQGPVARAGAAVHKGATGDRMSGQERESAQAWMSALEKILSNPQLAGKFKQLAQMAERQGAGQDQAAAIQQHAASAR